MNSTFNLLAAGTSGISQDLNTFLLAVVFLFMGLILGLIARKLLRKLLSVIQINNVAQKIIGVKIRLDNILSGLIALVIYAASVYIFLSKLGLARIATYFVIALFCIYLAVWLIVGAKDAFMNLKQGYSIRSKLSVGKHIVVDKMDCIVETVGLFAIEVRRDNGDLLAVPYQFLAK
jgi:hypothetical protein